jgi:hypothetical protein
VSLQQSLIDLAIVSLLAALTPGPVELELGPGQLQWHAQHRGRHGSDSTGGQRAGPGRAWPPPPTLLAVVLMGSGGVAGSGLLGTRTRKQVRDHEGNHHCDDHLRCNNTRKTVASMRGTING